MNRRSIIQFCITNFCCSSNAMKALLGVLDGNGSSAMSWDPVTGMGMDSALLLEPTGATSPSRLPQQHTSSVRPQSAGSALSHSRLLGSSSREYSRTREMTRSMSARKNGGVGSPLRRSIAGAQMAEEKVADTRMSLTVHQSFMQSTALAAPITIKDEASAQIIYGAQFSGLQVIFLFSLSHIKFDS